MRASVAERLNRGSPGNVGARCDAGFLLTPSGFASAAIEREQVINVDMDGHAFSPLPASNQWRIHRDIYGAGK